MDSLQDKSQILECSMLNLWVKSGKMETQKGEYNKTDVQYA